jgi:hypothetical protein
MVPRKIKHILKENLKNYPAVGLLGARQTGKTTLARTISDQYFDLEVDSERLRLELAWPEVVESRRTVVLDEAQHFPEIFPRIRNAIDAERKRNGRFLILGSVSPGLMKQVSEFLTGRIALAELCPLFMGELEDVSQDDLWLMGGFPDGGILRKGQFPKWQQNYLDLLAMRDLPSWGLPAKPSVTKRFFKMVAAAHGTLWNASQLGKSMGLSYHTINTYLDYLEQTYLIRRLQPFSANIRKRLVKSPKVYWRDSGLLHTLLNTFGFDNLIAQPWVGHSWEGWVIEQILANLQSRGLPHEAYFLRTSDGHEIDLVLIIDGVLWAFEIKLSAHVDRKDLERLNKAGNLIGAKRKVLLSRSEEHIESKDIYATNLKRVIPILLR